MPRTTAKQKPAPEGYVPLSRISPLERKIYSEFRDHVEYDTLMELAQAHVSREAFDTYVRTMRESASYAAWDHFESQKYRGFKEVRMSFAEEGTIPVDEMKRTVKALAMRDLRVGNCSHTSHTHMYLVGVGMALEPVSLSDDQKSGIIHQLKKAAGDTYWNKHTCDDATQKTPTYPSGNPVYLLYCAGHGN